MMDNKVGSILLTEFKNGENVLAKVSPRVLDSIYCIETDTHAVQLRAKN